MAKKKNDFLARMEASRDIWRQAERETYLQFMLDIMAITLNDPEAMGKNNTFGKVRVGRYLQRFEKNFDKYHAALEKSDETSYWQYKLDQHLISVLGDDTPPFKNRYEWIKEYKK